MTNETPLTQKQLSAPRNGVRLFKEDDVVLLELSKQIKSCDFKIDMLDLIREAIHYGLPQVKGRWDPIVKAAESGGK